MGTAQGVEDCVNVSVLPLARTDLSADAVAE